MIISRSFALFVVYCLAVTLLHVLFRSVHSVCLWDEKGAPKVQLALQQDIVEFIRDAQIVCTHHFSPAY
jgi:hypothetical protein